MSLHQYFNSDFSEHSEKKKKKKKNELHYGWCTGRRFTAANFVSFSTITGKAVSSGYFGDVFLTPGKILKFERNCRGFPFCIYEKTHTDSCKFYDIGLVCESKYVFILEE